MTRVFVVKAFARWLKGQELVDADLVSAVKDAEKGIVAAQLGGGLVKLRIARQGEGKSGGYRTVVAFEAEGRSFYLEGFAKNEKDNIGRDDLQRLKVFGRALRALDEDGLRRAMAAGEIREIGGER